MKNVSFVFRAIPGQIGAEKNRSEQTYLFGSDRALGGLVQLLNGLGVMAQILLAANEDDGETLAEMKDLRDPLDQAESALSLGFAISGKVPE